MNKLFHLVAFFLAVAFTANAQNVTGLVNLDRAMAGAVQTVEAKVQNGTEIAIGEIDAPTQDIADFLNEELVDSFGLTGKLIVLARGKEMKSVINEQNYQMSGMVDDKSAVRFGHALGAKVVITGTFDRYGNFSQLRLRAVDMRTEALLVSYSARITNDDPVLAGISKPLENIKAPVVSDATLEHLNKGKDYIATGNINEAKKELDKALKTNTGLPNAYFYRGNTYYKGKNYDKAIAEYTQAIKLNPNYTNAYYNRGNAYYYKKDYDKAIADYTQAIKLDPNRAKAYYNRGIAYMDGKKDIDKAIEDYTQAIKLDPNHSGAYNNRGLEYHYKSDYDQAIADYNQAIKLNPNYAKAYHNRGLAYKNKNDYDQAIADYNQAIKLDPNYAEAYVNRGNAYYYKKDIDRAIADFSQAIRVNPNHASAYVNRAYMYMNHKKDYNRAIADCEAALRINPNLAEAKENLEIARKRGK